jgi:serine/threonine-protein kinase
MAVRALGHQYLIGRSLRHYLIVEKVGEGGMGEVYRGRDEHLARDVAIKVFHPGTLVEEKARKRFRKEAQTLSQLNHPNIATIYDFDRDQDTDFLAMEFIAGQTVSDKLVSGSLSETETLRLGVQLAEGLVAAHAVGVIHCDIKPGNLRITRDGRLKIVDFGLARINRPSTGNSATRSAEELSVAGTLPYMAPEQLRALPLDDRIDIYAAGVVMYEMATGRRPFRADHSPQLVEAILHETPPPPATINPKITAPLETVILKCLEKTPQNRYATASDFLLELRALQASREDGKPRLLPHRPSRRQGTEPKTVAISLGIALVLAAALLIFVPGAQYQVRRWFGVGRVPTDKLVAVLPFTVLGSDQTATPFSDGLTETLTAKLTQLTIDPTLQVVPAREIRTSAVKRLDQARSEFGVTQVLEGSLYRVGENFRVNIALVDTHTRRQILAESFTAPASDPFAVEDKVVAAAVGMLELNVRPKELERVEAHGTPSPGAYVLYLQGRGYLQNYDNEDNINNAIHAFNNALQMDPKYSLAYAGRGDAYWQMYEEKRQTQWVDASRRDCERAIDLDSALPAAHVCLGKVFKGTGKYQEAAAEFERAVEKDPTNDRAFMELGQAYELLGNIGQAEATYQRAIKLRPHYWAGYNWLGVFYYDHANYEKAAHMFEQVVAIAPDNIRGQFNLAAAYTGLGRYDDAITVLKRSIAIRPEATAFTNLGNAYFYLRRYEEATAAYEQAINLDQTDLLLWANLGDGYYWTPGKRERAADAYQRAIILAEDKLKINSKDVFVLGISAVCHAMRDEKKSALDLLSRALQLAPNDPEIRFKAALISNHFGDAQQALSWLEKAVSVGASLNTIRDTPNFDSLRKDPRFEQLVPAK